MTPEQIKAYCQAEIAKLKAREQLMVDEIHKMRGGQQAYQDIIDQLEQPQQIIEEA